MTLLLIGIFVTELVKYGVWFKKIGGLSFTRCYLGGIVAVSYIVLICMGVVNENTLLFFWNLAAVLMYGMIMKCSSEKRVIYVLQALLIVICLGEIINMMIRLIGGTEWWNDWVELRTNYLINNVIVIFLLLIISLVREKVKYKYVKGNEKIRQWGMYLAVIIMGIAIFLTVNGFQNIVRYVEDKRISTFSVLISFLSFICIACLVMMVSYIFNENKRYKLYLEKDMLLLETQKNMYETMLAKNEETRKFRHDIQNHLICLYELADFGNLEKVKNYIRGMEGSFNSNYNKVYIVGNSVVDAVLNYYISMLEKGVKVSVDGICSEKIKMTDAELCTVISNLIQNAEEALNRSAADNKYLNINFNSIDRYLNIRIKNSITENAVHLDNKNEIPKTTKINNEEHGIGMKNVKSTVEKNGGMFEVKIENKEFVVHVMIPLDIE